MHSQSVFNRIKPKGMFEAAVTFHPEPAEWGGWIVMSVDAWGRGVNKAKLSGYQRLSTCSRMFEPSALWPGTTTEDGGFIILKVSLLVSVRTLSTQLAGRPLPACPQLIDQWLPAAQGLFACGSGEMLSWQTEWLWTGIDCVLVATLRARDDWSELFFYFPYCGKAQLNGRLNTLTEKAHSSDPTADRCTLPCFLLNMVICCCHTQMRPYHVVVEVQTHSSSLWHFDSCLWTSDFF